MTAPVLPAHAAAEAYRVGQAKIAADAAAGVALAHKVMLNKADLNKGFTHYATVAAKIINASRANAAALGGAFYLQHREASGVLAAMPEIAWAPQVNPALLKTSLLVTGPVAVKRALSMGSTIEQALHTAEVKTAAAAYRHTANGGRVTIKGTLHRDEAALGWARVSDGRPCPFCAMLCSRGVVYKSATTAGISAKTGSSYHDNCGCFVVPIYSHDDPIPGLGPELEQLWEQAQREKDPGVSPFAAFRAAYNAKYPEGSNPSAAIAQAQLDAAKAEAAANRSALEAQLADEAEKAAREAEKIAKAAAEAAAEAERIATKAAGMDVPKPKPENLKLVGSAGGSHGAAIYEDIETGRKWVFKAQVDVMVDVDVATAKLAKRLGRPAADTYPFEMPDPHGYGSAKGSIQLMLTGGDAFPGPDHEKVDPEKLSAADLLALQKEHVLDWLFANHDAHKANFVRDADSQLAGIDKGQALKFFGRDKLDWNFFPNQHEPIYNTIYKAFAEGKNVTLLDPNEGELSIFIHSVMNLPDDDLKAMFRPYAEAAAARGWLLAGSHWKPGALEPQTLPVNDVEAFLDALVKRKNSLTTDFGELFYRAKAERTKIEQAQAEAEKKAKLEKKWKGKPKPQPPTEPDPPKVDGPQFFDGWLAKVTARYDALGTGKAFSASYNYTHVTAVIEQHDKSALDKLKAGKYVDDALYQEALDTMAKVEQAKATVLTDAGYKKALRSYRNLLTRYKRYVQEWREINGVTAKLEGLAGALRHSNYGDADKWARTNVHTPSGAAETALNVYSGNSYDAWNGVLRKNASTAVPAGPWEQYTKDADSGFSPLPQDVIVHRGTTFREFAFPDGSRIDYVPPPDPRELIGTVQSQHGYWSTSVGHRSAFFSKPVQLIIRLPAGHRAAYIRPISQFKSEMEMLVQRSTRYFIHDAYQRDGKWWFEVEVLPIDADPADFADADPMPLAEPDKIRPAQFSDEYDGVV
ncbi:ADP-ribosyltransferase [Actinoplanes philippinensis]|uniref:VG15 protein n=1 Tax=Actinoplanes philippinensis TaxID=35752 RepID=UPI00340FED21